MSRTTINLYKKEILDIYHHAINAVKPESLIHRTLEIDSDAIILRNPFKNEFRRFEIENTNIHVIGGGKSVFGMAFGLSQLVKKSKARLNFSHGILSVPIGLQPNLDPQQAGQLSKELKLLCYYGSKNNLPDDDSVFASKLILNAITQACREDIASGKKSLFLVLISGGGSACLTSPRFINLDKKLDLIKHLVQRGADIIELNKVRRYFSNIKGGQLAAHILRANPSARIMTLIMSDVIGDQVEYIASGPTVINENLSSKEYYKDMHEILTKYNYSNIRPLVTHSSSILDPDKPPVTPCNIINMIIGNNKVAREAAIDKARQLDFHVVHMDRELSGPSEEVMLEMVRESYKVKLDRGKKTLTIGGGEAVVSKQPDETWGLGGRAQEMALDYIIHKLRTNQKCIGVRETDIFLAGGTDGQDGPTDCAGCLASLSDLLSYSKFSIGDLINAKKSHNSHEFWNHKKPDWLIRTGLTGTNVMDLYMHSRCSSTHVDTVDNLKNEL